MNSDLTFFTNEPGATLLDRFKKILTDVKFFDVLVGYFRTSGFHQLYTSLEDVEKIRILVGLTVDRKAFELIEAAQAQMSLNFESHKTTKELVSAAVVQEMDAAKDDYETELGVQKFIEFIQSGKLEIKAYPSANLHAKVYIGRFHEDDRDVGRVITGSSNFSLSGLVANREFNVELKNPADVEFALDQFEKLWVDAVDISEEYVATIQQRTWLNDTITPYELYLKMLYEYLKEDINIDEEDLNVYLPNNFMELAYQKQAVTSAKKILDAYGGVFLADVVGLGKTYISALLAQQLSGRILVICPPVLQDYWRETFFEFGIRGYEVESLGKLEAILERGVQRYQYVLIDEAHRFRNEGTQAYDRLSQICAGKKVILVSATPLNNKIGDIFNQLKLFQPPRKSSIPGVGNLERFFRRLEKAIAQYEKDDPDYLPTVKAASQEIRAKVLRHVMVRRTRTEILNFFSEDLRSQGLSFPKLAEPQKIVYEFDDKTEWVFNQTIRLLRRFNYARYTPLLYLNQPASAFAVQAQRNIGAFMKSILVKRLESSFYAFGQTLERFIESYIRFIQMYEQGNVLISKEMDVYDLLERDDPDELLELIDQDIVQQYGSEEFREDFIDALKADLVLLQDIDALWERLETDPKLNQFIDDLKRDRRLKNQKMIVFTESKETGEHLYAALRQEFPGEVLFYASGGGVYRDVTHNPTVAKRMIQRNFDPQDKEQENEIRILITTDVLAEGINLHRANVVVNYDLPWNPTRVLQRVGRVNRVGTRHEEVYIFNFFPTAQSEEHLGLENNIIAKIQAFHDTLGEDAKYLSDVEEVTTHNLFGNSLYRKLNDRESYEGAAEEERSELEFLQLLRHIRDLKPDLFERIKRLPRKARTARLYSGNMDRVLTFFRQGLLKKFFITDGDEKQELDFFEAVDYLRCEAEEPKQKIPKRYYDLLQVNKDAFLASDEDIDVSPAPSVGGSSHDNFMIKCLKAKQIRLFKGYTDEDEAFLKLVREAFQEGRIPKKTAQKVRKEIEPVAGEPLKFLGVLKREVPTTFLVKPEASPVAEWQTNREVILSEYLVGAEGQE
jgi:superfamily II DNA or RNA helicase/HKD family nuclease